MLRAGGRPYLGALLASEMPLDAPCAAAAASGAGGVGGVGGAGALVVRHAVPLPPPLSPQAPWALSDILWHASSMRASHATTRAPPGTALLPGLLLLPAGSAGGGEDCKHAAAAAGAASPPPRAPARSPPAPLACRVPGCGERLEAHGAYYARTKLCPSHLRAEALHMPEGVQRFCQKYVAVSACVLRAARARRLTLWRSCAANAAVAGATTRTR
jgi:hypothetical protein